ncbi:MAG: zinc ribbon domain-containing protein [Eggerthellaceae bacterium]|nr:zinc ribbon domain-containing protein [Eggerthellaceae bacterium]
MSLIEKSQVFQKNPEVSLDLLARGIEQFLIQQEGMVCQLLQTPAGISVQTRKKAEWKKYAMLDNALQIDITEAGPCVNVKVGGGKWVSKGVAAGVGMIVAWPIGVPLMALSLAGGYGTMGLPKKILDFTGQFLMTGGKNITIPPVGSEPDYSQYELKASSGLQTDELVCPGCDTTVPAGTKFCPECGISLVPKKELCPGCGAEIEGTPKFCPECGASLAPKKNVCPSCGVELEGTPKFCPECGAETAAAAEPQA